VRIALLDTWPMTFGSADYLGQIRAFCRFLEDTGQDHQLLDRFARGLIVPSHRFRDYVDQSSLQAICAHGRDCSGHFQHEYRISDHGLFIADILNNIAPRAEISVYRVLNDFGVLHFYTLARAIEQALYDAHGRSLVLNLSLGFAPELRMVKELLQNPLDAYDRPDEWGERCVADARKHRDQREEKEALEEPAMEPLKFLFSFDCNDLRDTVFAAAAAGNDSCRDGELQVAPRFPAAIPGVLSVAAVDRDGRAASYSNEDDITDPQDDGVSAYGGKIDQGTDTAKDDAPVGLYISDNLPYANENGFARWSGFTLTFGERQSVRWR
jgi:subtilase family protein